MMFNMKVMFLFCSFHEFDEWEWAEVDESDEKNVAHTAAYKRWQAGPKIRESPPHIETSSEEEEES